MHSDYITCASCDIPSKDTTLDDFDLPVCRLCRKLLLSHGEPFATILDQRAYVRSVRVTVIHGNPVLPPPKRRSGRKWSHATRERLSR